tara:strand:+ start:2391 stop:3377 length:987 start_codon:yes stop_codon:yes gene_type:complete
MALKITGLKNDTVDPAPTDKAMGGTELQRKWLFENVPDDLLNEWQIICSRVRKLKDKPRILWLHDLAIDDEVKHLKDPEKRKRFDRLVFVSNWQRQQYEWFLGIPPSEMYVLRNAIYPMLEVEKPTDQLNLIYHTTPHRGLNILVPVFVSLAEKYDNIHLDVYSSFNIYGWDDRDKPYEGLFDQCRNHPKITYHGTKPNSVIRKALAKSHIFAYPSIWPETSCIAAMEALSAKNLVICPNLGALPETTGNFAWMYPWNENINAHANLFANTLNHAIQNYANPGVQQILHLQKVWVDQFFSWDHRKEEWIGFLRGAKEQRERRKDGQGS